MMLDEHPCSLRIVNCNSASKVEFTEYRRKHAAAVQSAEKVPTDYKTPLCGSDAVTLLFLHDFQAVEIGRQLSTLTPNVPFSVGMRPTSSAIFRCHFCRPTCRLPGSHVRGADFWLIIIIIIIIITEFLVRLLHEEHRCITES